MKKMLILGFIVALVFCSVWKRTQQKDIDIHQIETDTFAQAYFIKDREIEDVYIYLVIPFGEIDNSFDEGLAHYVEHLAWLSGIQNSETPKKRHSNAWTTHFSTGYWVKTDHLDFDRALETLMSVSKPFQIEAEFALEERDIVAREYDARVLERPLYPVFDEIDHVLYGEGTLARSVIGTPDLIKNYRLEDATALHKQSHNLKHATVLVFGNIDKVTVHKTIRALSRTDDNSSQNASSAPLPKVRNLVQYSTLEDRKTIALSDVTEETLLYRKLVPIEACDDFLKCKKIAHIIQDAFNSTLKGGLSGPLQYDQFIARSLKFSVHFIEGEYAEISVFAHPDVGISVGELEVYLKETLLKSLSNGLPKDTFERVLERNKGALESIIERHQPRYNFDLTLTQLTTSQPLYSLSDEQNALEKIRLRGVNKLMKSLVLKGREVTRLVTVEGAPQ